MKILAGCDHRAAESCRLSNRYACWRALPGLRTFTSVPSSDGFSVIELTIVIVVLSVLLAVALPTLFNNQQAQLATAARMMRSDIAVVQRLAVHEGVAIEVNFTTDGYSVERSSSGTEVTLGGRFPVADLAEEVGVSIETTGTVTFNSLGEPLAGSLESITVESVTDSSLTKEVVIEAETGHVSVE